VACTVLGASGTPGLTSIDAHAGDILKQLTVEHAVMTLQLESPAFAHNGRIPDRCGYARANVNPPLRISGVPSTAASLALVVDDRDALAPAGKVWDLWVVWNIPPDIGLIPEGWAASVASEGKNDFGKVGYVGPNPPDTEHTYRFRLYALDVRLGLPTGATKDRLETVMVGRIVAEASLAGTFPPAHSEPASGEPLLPGCSATKHEDQEGDQGRAEE